MKRVLLLALVAVSCSSALAAPQPRFELPYDLVVARDGTIYFLDRSRILTLQPSTRRVRVYRTVSGASELAGLARLEDGTLFAADLPSGRILRIPRGGPVATVATVPMPVDLVADPSGSTLWVASIAEGTGLVRVDVASGTVEPFASVQRPHGVAWTAGGDFVVHDGHAVSRVDGATGTVTPFAKVDAFKVAVARDGVVYGATGGPTGGRVVRISPRGRVVRVAGTGRLGPHRDGRALSAPMLPSAVAAAPDGSLLVAQIEPVPAIRRVNLKTGRIVTLVRGR
jgi:streptogramin lyase